MDFLRCLKVETTSFFNYYFCWGYMCVCVYMYIEAISVVDFELVEEGKLEENKKMIFK